MKRIAGALAVLMLAAPAAAQTVVDGDTIKISAVTYRLWGIDAPESRQLCGDGWQAGSAATSALSSLMTGHHVECESRTRDRYGRTVALCRADGRDLGASMVSAGMALAFTRYSADYVEQEAAARAARAGMHEHVGCLAPWLWRAQAKPR